MGYVYEGIYRVCLGIKKLFNYNKRLYKPYIEIIKQRWDQQLKKKFIHQLIGWIHVSNIIWKTFVISQLLLEVSWMLLIRKFWKASLIRWMKWSCFVIDWKVLEETLQILHMKYFNLVKDNFNLLVCLFFFISYLLTI